MLPQASELMWL